MNSLLEYLQQWSLDFGTDDVPADQLLTKVGDLVNDLTALGSGDFSIYGNPTHGECNGTC